MRFVNSTRSLGFCLGLGLGGCLGSVLCNASGWAQSISRSEVEQVLDVSLRAAFEEIGTGLQIVALRHRTDLEVPDGVVSWQLGSDLANLDPGHHTLSVAVLVDGASVDRTRVMVTLKQSLQTPMLSRSIKRGEMVAEADVQMQDVVLTRPLPGRIEELNRVVGMVAKRGLREGRPLVDRWFEQPLAVDRGDRVRIHLVRGGLKIETSGVALLRGRVGDLIPIRNPQSRAQYEARIIAPGEARVRAW